MTEAKRRNEDDWHESLENESVRYLSRSFYNSFAKGHCSGSVAGKVGEHISEGNFVVSRPCDRYS